MIRAINASADAQKAMGSIPGLNTLSNALTHRDLEQMIEAWAMLLGHYNPQIASLGKKFARVAAVDASLIKLSLQAYNWAKYREKTRAAKITCVLDWVKGVPDQFVFTASGKVHDLKAALALNWQSGWTYLFDRGYFSFDLLTVLLEAGAHFVIRLKRLVDFQVVSCHQFPN